MSWCGWIADVLHEFQIPSLVEISNNGQPYKPLEANFQDASNLSIANQYIETLLDKSKETLFEAVQLGYVKHHGNECIVNACIDHYEYTLRKDNKRDISTREKIITTMGKTDKDFIKEGATINNMELICIKYVLKFLMFDACVERILYKSDPPFPDSHAKPFHCARKHSHVHVLNYDLKSLAHKLIDEGDKKRARASEDFYIQKEKDEDDEQCKMIHSLEYVSNTVKDHCKVKKAEEPTYNLVLRDDAFLFSLEYQGYEPAISHVCCKLTNIKVNLIK